MMRHNTPKVDKGTTRGNIENVRKTTYKKELKMENKMQDITYTINVNDLIEAVKKYNGAKIEFYENGEFAIIEVLGDGSNLECISNQYVYPSDFYDDCDGDVGKFTNWLRYYWRNGFPTFKDGNCNQIIHVNWVVK